MADEATDHDGAAGIHPRAGRARVRRKARSWHRLLGVLAALPLLWVVITGAVLNHADDWHLDQVMLTHPWVLAAYGMRPVGNPVGVEVAGRRVVEWSGQLFVDEAGIDLAGRLIGAVKDGEGLAIVTDGSVMRLGPAGEVIEVLDSTSLPTPPLLDVCASEHGVLLKNGDGWHAMSPDWLAFESRAGEHAGCGLKEIRDSRIRDKLALAWSRGGLPVSKVVLDLHAGHFLGIAGKYGYDLLAVCAAWLCGTGLILFFRKPRTGR